jgi:uncharacterized protein (UPF0147 family)
MTQTIGELIKQQRQLKFKSRETDTMDNMTVATASPRNVEAPAVDAKTQAILDQLRKGTYPVGNMLAKSSWNDDVVLKANPHTEHYDSKDLIINEDNIERLSSLIRLLKGVSESETAARNARWAAESLTDTEGK